MSNTKKSTSKPPSFQMEEEEPSEMDRLNSLLRRQEESKTQIAKSTEQTAHKSRKSSSKTPNKTQEQKIDKSLDTREENQENTTGKKKVNTRNSSAKNKNKTKEQDLSQTVKTGVKDHKGNEINYDTCTLKMQGEFPNSEEFERFLERDVILRRMDPVESWSKMLDDKSVRAKLCFYDKEHARTFENLVYGGRVGFLSGGGKYMEDGPDEGIPDRLKEKIYQAMEKMSEEKNSKKIMEESQRELGTLKSDPNLGSFANDEMMKRKVSGSSRPRDSHGRFKIKEYNEIKKRGIVDIMEPQNRMENEFYALKSDGKVPNPDATVAITEKEACDSNHQNESFSVNICDETFIIPSDDELTSDNVKSSYSNANPVPSNHSKQIKQKDSLTQNTISQDFDILKVRENDKSNTQIEYFADEENPGNRASHPLEDSNGFTINPFDDQHLRTELLKKNNIFLSQYGPILGDSNNIEKDTLQIQDKNVTQNVADDETFICLRDSNGSVIDPFDSDEQNLKPFLILQNNIYLETHGFEAQDRDIIDYKNLVKKSENKKDGILDELELQELEDFYAENPLDNFSNNMIQENDESTFEPELKKVRISEEPQVDPEEDEEPPILIKLKKL